MNEELIQETQEEIFDLNLEEVATVEINAEDLEQSVETSESTEVIEVEQEEEIVVEVDEAVGWVSGDAERHYGLLGRDERDQHPIKAITGLREELDDIEKLQTVFSNKNNHADYYKWKDESAIPEDSNGLFVSFYPTTNNIQVCNSTDDIFGVTVAEAGFVGGQTDIPRDYKYGLVVCSGIVLVRCEIDVAVGDSVISNNHGYAKKAESGYGYKVIALYNINSVTYAAIALGISVNEVNALMMELDTFENRMDKAEVNIVSAINVANAAHNKASNADSVSVEAIKNALEALNKANETIEKTDELETNVSSVNRTAEQAKAIAEAAVVSAETARNDAIEATNGALADVNDLIKGLEPITTWESEYGVGAEYLITYIEEDLATKAEVQTVETLSEENKSLIQKNAESFQTLVASVDKYSVGEFSQSYGLSREQASSILKSGMVYIPTKHIDTDSHSEKFVGESELQEFTPGYYYIWDGADWIESSSPLVAFFSTEPTPSRVLEYWYIDSDTAPEGYEPHALYIWKDEEWTKVNILDGNVTNRVVSMVRQTADGVALEVANARGSYTGLDARLTAADTQLQLATFWNNPDSGKSNLAAVNLNTDDDASKMALVVMSKDGDTILNGANIVLSSDEKKSSILLDADCINFEGFTTFLTADDLGANGTTTINGGRIESNTISAVCLKADDVMANFISALEITAARVYTDAIKSENYKYTSGNFSDKGTFLDLSDGTMTSPGFAIDSLGNTFLDGFIYARGGELNGPLYFEDSYSEYVLNSKDCFINIPGFQVYKVFTESVRNDKKYASTCAMINSVQLASLVLETEKEYGTSPQIYLTDNGMCFTETLGVGNNWGCLWWENTDGTPIMRLRGYSDGLHLEGLEYQDSNLDFKVFGMSMRDMLNRITALEGLSDHEHSYNELVSDTATCTSGGIATYRCSCGAEEERVSYKLGHDYSGGYCTRCGATDPNSSGGGGGGCTHTDTSDGGNMIDSCHTEMWYQCNDCGEILGTWIETNHGSIGDNGYCNDCGEYAW